MLRTSPHLRASVSALTSLCDFSTFFPCVSVEWHSNRGPLSPLLRGPTTPAPSAAALLVLPLLTTAALLLLVLLVRLLLGSGTLFSYPV